MERKKSCLRSTVTYSGTGHHTLLKTAEQCFMQLIMLRGTTRIENRFPQKTNSPLLTSNGVIRVSLLPPPDKSGLCE